MSACLSVFPELEGTPIKIYYKRLENCVLGQTRVKRIAVGQKKKRLVWQPVVEISWSLGDLPPETRIATLRHVIIHELVHISRAHLSRPKSNNHESDFDIEVIERFGKLAASRKKVAAKTE